MGQRGRGGRGRPMGDAVGHYMTTQHPVAGGAVEWNSRKEDDMSAIASRDEDQMSEGEARRTEGIILREGKEGGRSAGVASDKQIALAGWARKTERMLTFLSIGPHTDGTSGSRVVLQNRIRL